MGQGFTFAEDSHLQGLLQHQTQLILTCKHRNGQEWQLICLRIVLQWLIQIPTEIYIWEGKKKTNFSRKQKIENLEILNYKLILIINNNNK